MSLDDPCHHENLKLYQTFEGRVKTDVPIYAVLTQPNTDAAEDPNEVGMFEYVGDYE